MFENLFTYPFIIARHRTAPCPETRASFLAHCAEQGYPHSSFIYAEIDLATKARALAACAVNDEKKTKKRWRDQANLLEFLRNL
jgi:hypothetical protein